MFTRSFLLLLLLAGLLASNVQAQTTITVTTTNDELNTDGDCSLREAIQAANTNAVVSRCPAGSNTGTDVIMLPAGTYKLTKTGTKEEDNATGDLDIKGDLRLVGAGAATTVIDGNDSDTVLDIKKTYTVEITELTIMNGHAPDETSQELGWPGGGIYNDGTMTITNTTITGNRAGDVLISNPNFCDAGLGGGIANFGTMTITNTTITGNRGGDVKGDNTCSGGSGGAIFNAGSSTMTITNTTITGNRAGDVVSCTKDCYAGVGGGISDDGTMTITNTTITGNRAGRVLSCTQGGCKDGSGGGFAGYFSTSTLKNTILANNTAARGPECVSNSSITSGDYNLIKDPSGCTLTGTTTNNITGQDPKLGPLQDNSGSTPTLALLLGSPALDAIPNGTNGCGAAPLDKDQRGIARPLDGNLDTTARCDIGAFEVKPLPLMPQPNQPFTTRGDSVIVRVVLGDAASTVTDFFGLGFKLHYDATRLTFPGPAAVKIGSFFPTAPPQRYIDATGGTLSVSYVPQGSGFNGISGHGTVLEITFRVASAATANTISFSFSDILVIGNQGQQIPVAAQTGTLDVFESAVWPGDTDPSDCSVNQNDVLPLGVAWGRTGPARGFDLTWKAQGARAWATTSGTVNDVHVDATGDGTVTQNDLLPVGLNWGQTHAGCPSVATAKQHAVLTLDVPATEAGSTVPIYLNLDHRLDQLLGIAFELTLPPDLFTVKATRPGTFLDDGDLIALDRYDAETGTLAAAFTRKGTNSPATGTGTLVEIELEALQTLTTPTRLTLTALKLSQPTGSIADPASVVALSLEAGVATATEDADHLPSSFRLHGAYPNPFNPTTTIAYDLPETAEVTLLVYDMLGREVHQQLVGQQAAGAHHRIAFEAQGLASGIYLYRVVARLADRQEMQTGRFVLMK